jgi:hypothetical protein
LIFSFTNCSKEDDLGPPNEEFMGVYTARDRSDVIDLAKVDSVIFAIQRNTTYDLIFFKSTPVDKLVDFCNCGGTLLDFGTGKASFDPTFIVRVNCDTLRIPRGEFGADFRNHGDTLYLEREVTGNGYDSLYQFILLKVK